MLQYLIAVPMIGHGLAHISGFLASWIKNDIGFKNNPWVFYSNITLTSTVGRVFSFGWLFAMVFLLASGVGLILEQQWWVGYAKTGAILSLAVVVPWWNTVPPGAKIGVIFNIILLIVLFTPFKDMIVRM